MNTMKSFCRAAVLLLGVALLATPAHAQQTDADIGAQEKERAALYQQGVELADGGHWEQAVEKFRRVVALRSAPRALVALAIAEEKSGSLASARRDYERARDDARRSGDGALADQAAAAFAALDERVPRLVLYCGPHTIAPRVMLDGGPVNPCPSVVEIDPGEHRIVVDASGTVVLDRHFRIAERERSTIAVESPDRAASAAPATADRVGADRAPRAWSPPAGVWILGGAGAAAIIAGLAMRIAGKSDYDDASQGCLDARCTSQDAVDQGNRARDQMLAGTLVAGAGLAALGGAVAWWGLKMTSHPATAGPSAPLHVQASLSTEGGIVRLAGWF